VAESLAETQVRLLLERQCATLFRVLMSALPPDAAATLIFVDYGEPGLFKNTAYITALKRPELITTVEALVQRWKCGSSGEVLHDRERHGWVPDATMLEALGRLIKKHVPAGVGFALLFGKGGGSQYLATCDREGMTKMFEDDWLPRWREEVARG
jgi:hypothetical protein